MWCGKTYNGSRAYRKGMCGTCNEKIPDVRRFGKVRDDLRELLGKERLGHSGF